MEKSIVEIRKLASKYKNAALNKKRHEQGICYLCCKPNNSFADSHSVPISSLKNISEDGVVIGSGVNATLDIISDTVQGKLDFFYETGVAKAGVFQNICQSCENSEFQTIEDEKYFYVLPWNKEQLIKVALKSLLYENNMASYHYYLYLESSNGNKNIEIKKLLNCQEERLLDQTKSLLIYVRFKNLPSEVNFEIVIDEALDYETDFAMNAVFFPCHDGNLNDISKNNNYGLFVMALPRNGRTRVLVFYNKTSSAYFKLKKDLNLLDKKKKYEYLSRIILLHSDRYYINGRFKEKNKDIFNDNLFKKDYTFLSLNDEMKKAILIKLNKFSFFI